MIVEPATIREIAEWMRDGTWLDMRTPLGRAERVRVVRLLVTYEGDLLTVEQEWFDDADKIRRQTFEFDAEDCWDCRPTTVDFLEVRPLDPPSRHVKVPKVEDDDGVIDPATQKVIDAVISGAILAFKYLHKDTLLSAAYEHSTTHHRHQAILVIFEMTDLSAQTICAKVFGYRSPMPFQSASEKAHRIDGTQKPTDQAKGMRVGVRAIGDKADVLIARFRTEPARRTKPFPHDYRPTLKR